MDSAADPCVDEAAFAALIDELLDVAPADRAAWLRRRDDLPPLQHRRAERLLRADARAARQGLLEALPCLTAPDAAFAAEQRIGPFVLERAIGVGGMGEVWLARYADGRMTRRVALKLPYVAAPVALLASRFERERDALAALEHPHIARLYDAGVDAGGRPYLAMEFVDGAPIDRWCDERRLPLDARLALFLQVVDAVQFAHRSLIVHRDLKPGNVLVDSRGQVRLVDFGIAKLLVPDGSAEGPGVTETSAPALTPAYAAPEQFLGHRVTTATDVYSLGVLLYELLTGALPHAVKGARRAQLEAAVTEAEPTVPSRCRIDADAAQRRGVSVERLRARLKGDLDRLLAKALRREPGARYASADALAEDIRRHLRGEPIAAMPDRWRYRLAKFARRHRRVLAGAGVALLLSTAAGGLALRQFLEAQEQRGQADGVKAFLAAVLAEAEPSDRSGSDVVHAKTLLDQAVARADRDFASKPTLRGELLLELGTLYVRHRELDAGRDVLERALATLDASLPDSNEAVNRARSRLANTLLMLDAEPTRALALVEAALRACSARNDVGCARARGEALAVKRELLRARGDLAGALAAARQAVDAHRRGNGDRHGDTIAAWEGLAVALRNEGRIDEAAQAMDQALRGAETTVLRASYRRRLESSAALLLMDAGRYADAEQRFAALIKASPEADGANDSLAQLRVFHAGALIHLGLAPAALEEGERAQRRAEARSDTEQRAWSLQQQGRAASMLGRHAEAQAHLREALAAIERMTGAGPSSLPELPRRLFAEALARAGNFDAAADVLAVNIAHLRRTYPGGHYQIAQSQDLLGAVERGRGNFERARELHRQAASTLDATLGPQHPVRLRNRVYAELAERAGAERTLAALARYRQSYPPASHWHAVALRAEQALVNSVAFDPRSPEVVLAH